MSQDKRRPFPSQSGSSQSPTSPIIQTIQAQEYSGPIPHPDALTKYEQIQPGFADRIISMAEGESLHRRNQEAKSLSCDIEVKHGLMKERIRGQWCALTIALMSIVGACYMAYLQQPVPATALVGTAGVGMVTAFLYNQKKQE